MCSLAGSPVVPTCSAIPHTHHWPLTMAASQASSLVGPWVASYAGHLVASDLFELCWAPQVSDGAYRSPLLI